MTVTTAPPTTTQPVTSATAAAAHATPVTHRRRPTLPAWAAFTAVSLTFAAFYLAAGAPTPLLVRYQQQWHFAPWVLTVAFAVYAFALLAALLTVGSLSDHLGRRPVLLGSLVVELAAMLVFVYAPGIGWVIAARIVQGLATGAASGVFTAAVVELAPPHHKRTGSVLGTVAPAGGLGLGALLTGFAVQFSAHPPELVFGTLASIMVLGTIAVLLSAETVSRVPGALRSLVPSVRLPRAARREFARTLPVNVAAWMFAGLFMGLVPSIMRGVFHHTSGALNGVTVFIAPGSAALAAAVLGQLAARRTTKTGVAAVLTGTALIVLGIAAAVLPLLWIGGIIGGFGFGASFSGTLRALGPLAHAHERAGLFAVVFLVAYLSFGLPAIIAGVLVTPLGLLPTVLGYGTVVLLVAAAGLASQIKADQVTNDAG